MLLFKISYAPVSSVSHFRRIFDSGDINTSLIIRLHSLMYRCDESLLLLSALIPFTLTHCCDNGGFF